MPATDRDPSPTPPGQIIEAKRIFLAARDMGLAAREDYIASQCGGNPVLRTLVFQLLHGDEAPLPFASLADDIRAARDHAEAMPTADLEHGASAMSGASFGEHAGDRLGNFRLQERIGEGGFGVVYLAQQEEPVKRRVALKILKLGMDTRQVVARFEAERQALALMDHPGIAKVFDAGATEKGRPYFVMELVKGVPITEYCDLHRVSIRDRIELFAQVCDAIQHAHQKGVIHRDIKPSNVLVSTIGDKPSPKIIDFGIAKATSARLTEKTIFTEFRQMIGTPEYMSPEQAGTSGEDVDTRTDVYSLGVLLYELLSGVPPFDAKRLRSAAYAEMQRIIREEDPPRPSTRLTKGLPTLGAIASQRAMPAEKLPRALRGELDWIVMKTLEKDRTRRYDSAGSMGRDLQRYLRGEAIQAAPPSAAYRTRKFVQRHKGAVLAASLLSLALVAGLIGTTHGLVNANEQRKEAEKQRTRADVKAQDAFDEKQRADARAEDALAAQARANRSAYSANMLSASFAMIAHNPAAAKGILENAPEDQRGWEWRVLHSRLDTSVRELATPAPKFQTREPWWEHSGIPHPDGKSFFTVCNLHMDAAQRWDLVTGVLLSTYENPAHSKHAGTTRAEFTLSADGAVLYGVGHEVVTEPAKSDYFVAGWELRSGRRVLTATGKPERPTDQRPTISPDGDRLAFGGPDGAIWLQDVATGAILASIDRGPGSVERTFNRDGTLLAATAIRGDVEILDGRTLQPVAMLKGHTNMVNSIEFSHDGRWVATASIDGTARVWDLKASPIASVVLEHQGQVARARFSPDASLIATECYDVQVWNARTGQMLARFASEQSLPGTLMFMPDGRTVSLRELDGTVRFWDVTAGETVQLQGHRGLINHVAFAESTGLIVSGGWDGWKGFPGCVRFWDALSGEPVASYGEVGEVATPFAVSPDGKRAAITITHNASTDRDVIIDLETGRTVRIGSLATGLAFSRSSDQLAVVRDGLVEIRDARDGSVKRTRRDGIEGKYLTHPAWSPDGRRLAFSLAPAHPVVGPTRTWIIDAETMETMWTSDAEMLAFMPDGKKILASSPGRPVEIVNADTLLTQATVHLNGLGMGGVLLPNSDGSRLAYLGPNPGDVTVVDSAFNAVACVHPDAFVSSAAWDASGSQLVGAWGRTIVRMDDIPVRVRVGAREARREAIAQVESRVADLFARLGDAAKVADEIRTDRTLSPLQRRTALQLVLQRGLAAPTN